MLRDYYRLWAHDNVGNYGKVGWRIDPPTAQVGFLFFRMNDIGRDAGRDPVYVIRVGNLRLDTLII